MDKKNQLTTHALTDKPSEVTVNAIQDNHSTNVGKYEMAHTGDQAEILVVDDAQDNLLLLTAILEKRGYLVRAASNGSLALKSVAARLPNLILLDIEMPEMDGYELCSFLKSFKYSRCVPIIFISGLRETNAKIKAFKAGGIDFITKPVEPEEVFARIKTHLQLQEQNNLLENKVREYTKEIKEMQKAARIEKSRFLSRVNREIRTYLNPIMGYTESLRNENNLTAVQKDKLQVVHDNCGLLTTIISEVMEQAYSNHN